MLWLKEKEGEWEGEGQTDNVGKIDRKKWWGVGGWGGGRDRGRERELRRENIVISNKEWYSEGKTLRLLTCNVLCVT